MGKGIKNLRFLNGEISQSILADYVGCARETIASIETGKNPPSFTLVAKLAFAFGMSIGQFYQHCSKIDV